MRTRILLVVALVLSLVVVPAATGQSGKRTRNINATLHMASIGDNPPSGQVFAGELTGKPFGRSGMTLRNQVSGQTSTGKAVVYAKNGTIRANVTNQLQPQPDGSVNVPGTFKITGGTGRYRDATGKGTFQARLPANSTVFEATLTGKIRY
jgi:hypothetical protein